LTTAELLSLDNESPSDLFLHSGNIHGLLLALELLSCSDLLLGLEGKMPGCSVIDTGFLPVGCSGSTPAAAEGTTSGTTVDADVDAGASSLESDSA
jgi:hypothetical protein